MSPANPRINAAFAAAGAERALPVHSLLQGFGSRPLLVLAPHPDDESIGCGGLIAACAAASIPVFVHFLTDGRHSHPGSVDWSPTRIAAVREKEAVSAAAALGVPAQRLRFAREMDGALLFDANAADRAFNALADHASELGGAVIAAPWLGDPHPDHIAAALIAERLQSALPSCTGVRYIVWSDREFAASFVGAQRYDVSAFLQPKLRAIHSYRSQTGLLIKDCGRPNPMPALRATELQEEIYLALAP